MSKKDMDRRKKFILELMGDPIYQPMRLREISSLLRLSKEEKRELYDVLDELCEEGKVSVDRKGTGSSYSILALNYQYKSKKGNLVKPSQKMLASWIQSVSVLRNMCAHNSRIYNRTIHTTPEILDVDKVVPSPAHNGLYQILLAMKYLRSSDEEWVTFVAAFDKLIQNNIDVVSLTAMNLSADWKAHLSV